MAGAKPSKTSVSQKVTRRTDGNIIPRSGAQANDVLGLLMDERNAGGVNKQSQRTTGSVHAQSPLRKTEGANGGSIYRPDKVRSICWRYVVQRNSR